MPVQEVLGALRRAVQLLGAPGAHEAAYTAAGQVINSVVDKGEALWSSGTAELRRLLLALADKVAALDVTLQQPQAFRGDQRARDGQLLAGIAAAAASTMLGNLLSLEPGEALRAAAAARLAFNAGRAQLAATCGAAGTSAEQPVTPSGCGLPELTKLHLQLAANLCSLLRTSNAEQAHRWAPFVTDLPPTVLLRWMQTVTQALQACAAGPCMHTVRPDASMLVVYVTAVQGLLCSQAFLQHQRALSADLPLARLVTQVLASQALPALAGALEQGCTTIARGATGGTGGPSTALAVRGMSLLGSILAGEALPGSARTVAPGLELYPIVAMLCTALHAGALQTALGELLCSPEGPLLVQQAARLVRGLPTAVPQGIRQAAWCTVLARSWSLLGYLFVRMDGQLAHTEAGRLESIRGGGGGSSGGGRGASSASAHSSAQWQAACAAVVGLLPSFRAALQTLAAPVPAGLERASGVCCMFRYALLHSAPVLLSPDGSRTTAEAAAACGSSSLQEAAAWLAAADAAMQIVPLLCEMHAAWRQHQASANELVKDGPAELLSGLITQAWLGGAVAAKGGAACAATARGAAPGAGEPAREDLARQVWQAHSRGCRVLHWLVGSLSGSISSSPAERRHLQRLWLEGPMLTDLLEGLHWLLGVSQLLLDPGSDTPSPSLDENRRCMAAVCAAHWEAVQVAAALKPGTVAGAPWRGVSRPRCWLTQPSSVCSVRPPV